MVAQPPPPPHVSFKTILRVRLYLKVYFSSCTINHKLIKNWPIFINYSIKFVELQDVSRFNSRIYIEIDHILLIIIWICVNTEEDSIFGILFFIFFSFLNTSYEWSCFCEFYFLWRYFSIFISWIKEETLICE